jgi:hypothetical protein
MLGCIVAAERRPACRQAKRTSAPARFRAQAAGTLMCGCATAACAARWDKGTRTASSRHPRPGLSTTWVGKELAGGGTRQLTQPLPGSACRGGCPRAGAALQPVPQPDRGGALLERTGPVVKQAGIHHRDALGQRWGWGVLCHGRLLRQVHPSEPDRARVQTPPIERSAKDTGPCKPPRASESNDALQELLMAG